MAAVWAEKEAVHETGGRIPDGCVLRNVTGRLGSGTCLERVRDATGNEDDSIGFTSCTTFACSAASRSALRRFFR